MKATSAVSLSFLDLLTCCLGAMLLLFFVIVLMRPEGGGGQGGSESGATLGDGEKNFLVVSVESLAPETDSPTPLNWKLMRRGAVIEPPKQVFRSAGARFAIFYATEPLPRGAELWIEVSDSSAAYRVSVFSESGGESAQVFELQGEVSRSVYAW